MRMKCPPPLLLAIQNLNVPSPLTANPLLILSTVPTLESAVGHGIGGIDIPAKMAQLAKSLSQE